MENLKSQPYTAMESALKKEVGTLNNILQIKEWEITTLRAEISDLKRKGNN